eukprot:GHVN01039114.1.p1 GENE.GHVN01039114.1~~GHVN01039114.1.p1  ORF type:complete len:372 (+),score=97.26 GHVN01039114.1:375-1490(+)
MSEEVMISSDHLNNVINVDKARNTIRVQAGATLEQITAALMPHSLSLSNLPSISLQSIAGVLGTGTHGTGHNFGVMGTMVDSFQIVLPSGEVVECNESENRSLFKAGLCHLGCLGMITEVTLRAEPLFKLRSIQSPASFEDVMKLLGEASEVSEVRKVSEVSDNEHWRFWWIPHTGKCVVWKANRVDQNTPSGVSGGHEFARSQHWVMKLGLEAGYMVGNRVKGVNRVINKAVQRGGFNSRIEAVGYASDIFNFDCLFRQHVDEWSIPANQCEGALRELSEVIDKNNWDVHFPVEVRYTSADDIPLSPSHSRLSCWIGVIMFRPFNFEPPSYTSEYFKAFSHIMEARGGRPHWAKEHPIMMNDSTKKIFCE